MPEPRYWMFESFWLDSQDERLWHGATTIALSRKAFSVLQYLVRQSDRLVLKEELLDAVWPDVYVSESVVTNSIRELRQALGDQARRPNFIETVHRKGYRFIGDVTASDIPMSLKPAKIDTFLDHPNIPHHSSLFVGRECELNKMQQWFAVASQGKRQVGFIIGEPGIGKTTLIDTFVTQLDAQISVSIAHGQCIDHYGVGEPYLPLLEALGRLCRGENREEVVNILYQVAPSWLLHLPAVLPFGERERLAHSANWTTPAQMIRELADALELLTATCVLILVLEDLHWSDTSTLEWLHYLSRRRDFAKLLVLGTYRPVEVITRQHPLHRVRAELRQLPQCAELVLNDLSETEVGSYLSRRIGTTRFNTRLTQLLHARTNGNPLFLTSVINELLDQQGLESASERDQVSLVTKLIPENIRTLIERDLDQLSPGEVAILEAASVEGATFSISGVAAGVSGSVEAIETCCTTWARRGQFIQAEDVGTFPNPRVISSYRFRHSLYQEIVYDRIVPSHLIRLHLRIGLQKEKVYGARVEEIAPELAMHFERGKDITRAVQYLRLAGSRAASRSAHREAESNFSKGLQLIRQLPESPERFKQELIFLFSLRESLFPLGEFDRHIDYLHQAEKLAEILGDQHSLGRVLSFQGLHYWSSWEHDDSIRATRRSLAIGEAQRDKELQILARDVLSRPYFSKGHYDQAVTILAENLAIPVRELSTQRFGMAGIIAVLGRGFYVRCCAELGAFEEGQQEANRAVNLAEAAENPNSIVSAYHSRGTLAFRQRRYTDAIQDLQRAMTVCREADISIWLASVSAVLSASLAISGQSDDAHLLLEEEKTFPSQQFDVALRLLLASEAYWHLGQAWEALLSAESAIRHADTFHELGWKAWGFYHYGRILRLKPDCCLRIAENMLVNAQTLARSLNMRPLQAHCHYELGALANQMEDEDQASFQWVAAEEMYQSMKIVSESTDSVAGIEQT